MPKKQPAATLLEQARAYRIPRQRMQDCWPAELCEQIDEVIRAIIAGESGNGFKYYVVARQIISRLEELKLPIPSKFTITRYLNDRESELRNAQAR